MSGTKAKLKRQRKRLGKTGRLAARIGERIAGLALGYAFLWTVSWWAGFSFFVEAMWVPGQPIMFFDMFEKSIVLVAYLLTSYGIGMVLLNFVTYFMEAVNYLSLRGLNKIENRIVGEDPSQLRKDVVSVGIAFSLIVILIVILFWARGL